MSLSRKVLSDSAFSAVRIVVTMLRGVIVIPLITNLLGSDSYGIWATVMAFIGLATAAGGFHLHGSLIRYSSEDRESEQTYSDILSVTVLLGVLLAAGIGIAGTVLDLQNLFSGMQIDHHVLLLSVGLLVFLRVTYNININFPRSKGFVKLYDMARMSTKIAESIVLIVVFLSGGTVVTGILSLAIVSVMANVIMVGVIAWNYQIPTPDPSNFPKYLRYGGPMVPKEISTALMNNSDKYILLLFLTPTAVGIYSVSYAICTMFRQMSSALNPTLYPSVAKAWDEGKKAELRSLYEDIFRYYSILAIPAYFGVSFLSFPLISLLSNPEIARKGQLLIPILALAFMTRGYDGAMTYILTSAERTGLIAKGVLTASVLNILLNLAFILKWGIEGAALGTAISHVVLTWMLYRFSKTYLEFQIPVWSISRSIVASLVMVSVLLVVNLDVSPLVSLLVYPPIGASVYFVVLFLTGEFQVRELLHLVRQLSA